jgi:hypothetical protein
MYSASLPMDSMVTMEASAMLSWCIRLEYCASEKRRLRALNKAAAAESALMLCQPSGRIMPKGGISQEARVTMAIRTTTASQTRLMIAILARRAGAGLLGDRAGVNFAIVARREVGNSAPGKVIPKPNLFYCAKTPVKMKNSWFWSDGTMMTNSGLTDWKGGTGRSRGAAGWGDGEDDVPSEGGPAGNSVPQSDPFAPPLIHSRLAACDVLRAPILRK